MRVGANIYTTISMSIHSLHVRYTSNPEVQYIEQLSPALVSPSQVGSQHIRCVHVRDRNMAKAGMGCSVYIGQWRTEQGTFADAIITVLSRITGYFTILFPQKLCFHGKSMVKYPIADAIITVLWIFHQTFYWFLLAYISYQMFHQHYVTVKLSNCQTAKI